VIPILPYATQGFIRTTINDMLQNIVHTARGLYPIKCPAPVFVPPNQYLNFTGPLTSAGLDAVDSLVGGSPVKLSAVGVNSLLNDGLQLVLLNNTKLNPIVNPAPGSWIMPELYTFQVNTNFLDVHGRHGLELD